MAQVTLIIDQQGQTTLEVHGVTGPQCQELTAQVERLLGTVRSIHRKAEFHELPGESAQLGVDQF